MRFRNTPLAGDDKEVFSSAIIRKRGMGIGSEDCLEGWSATNCLLFPLSVWPNDHIQAHAHMHTDGVGGRFVDGSPSGAPS